MLKITSHLWFDTQAKEASQFYQSVFQGSEIKEINTLHNTPSGDVDTVVMDIWGHEFMMISAGPLFKFNPSISFAVSCKSTEEVDELYEKLSQGGQVMMELGSYPFSPRYAWVSDKYGLSWQIMYSSQSQERNVVPTLMYVGQVCGKAEEAVNFYITVFKNSKVDTTMYYENGEEPDKAGAAKYIGFMLEGQQYAAMDSSRMHDFSFNEAISLMINCDTQEEIDYYWEKLSADPSAEQCGWLKDKYGVSWQVNPRMLDRMLADPDQEKVTRITKAFLSMKKFDIEKLQEAYDGK